MTEPVKYGRARSPDREQIDRLLGAIIKERGRAIGQPQFELACEVGVSVQQLQCYMRGDTRLHAATLYEIAQAQRTPIAYYFDEMERRRGSEPASG